MNLGQFGPICAQKMADKKPKYGGEAFAEYAQAIVNHPAYAGMPDPIGDRGEIQWEAPSNRGSGRFKDTHHKRREWWRKKALSIGLVPDVEANWISKAAKRIHPFGKKPCKSCGKEMWIAYCYPNEHLFARIRKLPYWDDTFELSTVEHVCDLVARMDDRFGEQIFNDLPKILETTSITIPVLPRELAAWQQYIAEVYIPLEPRMLSPGAMANPPDRFDGFHSYNRCCRVTADKGRTKENLSSYVTDRRVFEYWVDGDWVAADRLMGKVRSSDVFRTQQCFNASQGGTHPMPVQADHIGPISLGFSHRPQFQLLCRSCNSGKNNRMYASDVQLLLRAEEAGQVVVSWYARTVWNCRKRSVEDGETALRLSKLMRDNRHTYMGLLQQLLERKHFAFLASLLHLECAQYDPEFEGLTAEDHLTKFKTIVHTSKTTKYVVEQKARRIRIAFTSLADYHRRQSRNAIQISNDLIRREINDGIRELDAARKLTNDLDNDIERVLVDEGVSEENLRLLASHLTDILAEYSPVFDSIKGHFQRAMDEVGRELGSAWEADRYVRSAPDELME